MFTNEQNYLVVLFKSMDWELFSGGTGFEQTALVKFRLSYKHLLLLVGVVVAIIIAITAFNEARVSNEQESNTKSSDERKLNLSIFPLKFRKGI